MGLSIFHTKLNAIINRCFDYKINYCIVAYSMLCGAYRLTIYNLPLRFNLYVSEIDLCLSNLFTCTLYSIATGLDFFYLRIYSMKKILFECKMHLDMLIIARASSSKFKHQTKIHCLNGNCWTKF